MKLLPALLFTGLLALTSAQAALVAHWKLDESTGTTATDSSPFGNNGTWQGTAGSVGWQPAGGISGGAVQFTGLNRDSFIKESFGNVTALPFTMACWVKATSTANMGLVYVGTGGGSSYYILRQQTGLAKANARNTTEVQLQYGTSIADGNWHHIAGVYTSATSRDIYVDGVFRATSTTSVPDLVPTRLGIGALARNTPYSPADLFTGLMDDVQVYNTALSAADIMFLFQNPGSSVGQPPVNPVISSFGVSTPELYAGESATLSWQAANATSVTIDQGIGTVALTGSLTITPAATTTYTITATNAAGSVTRDVTIAVLPAPAPPRALIHWPLDEGSGTAAGNSLGNNYGGIFAGAAGPVWETPGSLGAGAISFANTASAVRTDATPTSGYPFSMSAWVRTTSTENDTIVTLTSANNSRYHSLRINGGLPAITSRYDTAYDTAGPAAVNDGQWHLLTGVWESRALRKLYVDGAPAASGTASAAFEPAVRWSIGSLDRASGPVDTFTGSVDDPAFFTGRLTADDVKILHGAMTGLGLNHGQSDTLRLAFNNAVRSAAGGAIWEPVTGLAGAVGSTSGTIAGGDAAIVMNASGGGMRIQPDAPPVVLSFTVDNSSVAQRFPVTLTWNTFGGTSISISPAPGIVAASGSATVGAAATFTITATNANGTTTQTLNVNVAPGPVHPVIAEFQAVSDGGLRDNDGDASDWIELENRTAYTLSTAGYALTDNPLTPAKWPLPSTVLAPGQRLLIWASNKNRTTGQWHTNFTLDGDGEYLALTRSSGAEIIQEFAPVYPPQSTAVTYGLPTGSSTPAWLSPATPDGVNPATGFDGVVKNKVIYSIAGGIFTAAPSGLVLSHLDPAVTIRYTLDRTLPTDSSSAYSTPINLTGTTVVSARAFRAGYVPGPLQQIAYIVSDNAVAAFTSTLPVVVVDTHNTALLDDGSNEAKASIAIYEPVAGVTTVAGAPVFTGIAGVHVRGQTTSTYPKKPYDIELRDAAGQDLDAPLLGFPADSDWMLDAQWNDRALLRSALSQKLWEDMGYYNIRGKPVEVYVNSDSTLTAADYAGIYWMAEDIKRGGNRVDVKKLEAYQNSIPEITGGYIFSADKVDAGDLQVGGGDGNFIIREPAAARITPQQTAWLGAHLTGFNTVLNGANWLDPSLGYQAYIDRVQWIDYHILREFSKEVDSFVFSCHYHKDRGGKIMMGPQWDFDRAWGNSSQTLLSFNAMTNPQQWVSAGSLDAFPGAAGTRGRYWLRLFQDPDFMQIWIDRWQHHMDTTLSEAHVHACIDALAARNGTDPVTRNFARWNNLAAPAGASPYSFADYAAAVTQVKTFSTSRLAWIQSKFVARPAFSTPPGTFTGSLALELTGPAGASIYYTTDGTDPRASGGAAAGTLYSGAIPLTASTLLRARALVAGSWSGLREGTFTPAALASAANLQITEINYNPGPRTSAEITAGVLDKDQFEFIELRNTSAATVDLSGVSFTTGIAATLPNGLLLPAGGRVVIVRDAAAFAIRYPDALYPGLSGKVAGTFTGALDNGGERLVLTSSSGGVIADLTYDDTAPWPASPDGSGPTLVLTATPYAAGSALSHPLMNGNPGGPDTGYAIWAQANAASADGQGDNDQDGLADLVEYMLGSSTAASSISQAPSAAVQSLTVGMNPPADYMTMSFTRAPNTGDIQIFAETSTSLDTWNPDAVPVSETSNPDGSTTLTWRSPAPLSTDSRRQMRIRVVRP